MTGIIITAVILIGLGGLTVAKKRKNTNVLAKADNARVDAEYEVFNQLHNAFASETMLEHQRKQIAKVHQLDLSEREQKSLLMMQNYKMVKSLETFNICLELIRNNPILADMLKQSSENDAVVILRDATGLDDSQFKDNLPMLKQTVALVKSGKCLPKAV